MSDARFEDGMDKPLRLIAFDAEDLQVLSAMTQDAVWPAAQMVRHTKERPSPTCSEGNSRSPVERIRCLM